MKFNRIKLQILFALMSRVQDSNILSRKNPSVLYQVQMEAMQFLEEGGALSEGNFCIVAPGVEQALFTADSNGIAVNILMRASTFTRTFSTLLYEQGILGDFFWKMAYTNYCNRVLFFSATPDDRMKQTVLRLYEQAQLETKKSNLVQESYVCILLGEGIRRHRQNMKILEGFDGSVRYY